MPRVSNFEVMVRGEQPALSVRVTTSVEKLPQIIGESYGKIMAYMKEAGAFPSDAPYVTYYNMDMQNLDVEMGFPVAEKLAGNDAVKPASAPSGKLVTCMYRGPYAEIEPVYNEKMKWIEDNGFKPTGAMHEYYYNGPGFPPSEALTLLVTPVQ
ncbi:MAG: GyrI-like domain-containing protein [Oscillospiraceae bacterium]|nr:GyrI-like domain-containing protein [Oscillospiraceae bacterium]